MVVFVVAGCRHRVTTACGSRSGRRGVGGAAGVGGVDGVGGVGGAGGAGVVGGSARGAGQRGGELVEPAPPPDGLGGGVTGASRRGQDHGLERRVGTELLEQPEEDVGRLRRCQQPRQELHGRLQVVTESGLPPSPPSPRGPQALLDAVAGHVGCPGAGGLGCVLAVVGDELQHLVARPRAGEAVDDRADGGVEDRGELGRVGVL
ncbi:MAG: hypothetical protein EA340_12025 [Nitriliruptor sp.]|nr:MAG: hypothetical protein EA340_12025 [Nitriliruptor sp.]